MADSTNYGLIGNIAGGLREAMILKQTMDDRNRNWGLLKTTHGVEEGPDGQIQYTQAKQQEMASAQEQKLAEAMHQKQQYEQQTKQYEHQNKQYAAEESESDPTSAASRLAQKISGNPNITAHQYKTFGPYFIEQSKEKAKNKNGLLSPVPGFEKTNQYVGTGPEEVKLRKGYTDVQKFNNILDALKGRVEKADRTELVNPYSDSAKAIKNDLRDLQLLYKSPSFAELGVLSGPDLKLLEQVMEDPGTISNLFSGKQGVMDRYNQLKDRVNVGYETAAQTYGLRPTISYADKKGKEDSDKQKNAGLIKKGTTGQVKMAGPPVGGLMEEKPQPLSSEELSYAKKHNLSNEEFLALKAKRTGGQ